MKKATLRRIAIRTPLILLAVLLALMLFGRSIGQQPLPWHTAWMAVFGKDGWKKGFRFSVRNDFSKQRVLNSVGIPEWILIDDETYDYGAIPLMDSRPSEVWFYAPPFPDATHPGIAFRNNRVVDH